MDEPKWNFWSKQLFLTPRQAASLLARLEPTMPNEEYKEQDAQRLVQGEALLRQTNVEKIFPGLIRPSVLMACADKEGVEMPPPFREAIRLAELELMTKTAVRVESAPRLAAKLSTDVVAKINKKSFASLLKMVAALAYEYLKFDSAENKRRAAKTFQERMLLCGLSMDVDTIHDWLVNATTEFPLDADKDGFK